MWLSCSSVGRKFVMAVTGAVLVLFLTFHCCMNSIAICWPAAYNSLCEFLGANWYALIASVFLALFILVHIIYAVILTLQNRKARGPVGYEISKRPKTVEWSSKNMLILGIVILAFLVVHLIQFWAKMQLQEIRGVDDVLPPAAGTLFLQEAFSLVYTPIVYIIGFVALWFHLNHGIWSMFQSTGWDNTVWIARLKKVAVCWSTIIVGLFVAQAIVFTVKAHEGYFLKDPVLREQYKEMIVPMYEKDFGPDAAQVQMQLQSLPFEDAHQWINQVNEQLATLPLTVDDPQIQMQAQMIPDQEQREKYLENVKIMINQAQAFKKIQSFFDYLNPPVTTPADPSMVAQPDQIPQQAAQPMPQEFEFDETEIDVEPVSQDSMPASDNQN